MYPHDLAVATGYLGSVLGVSMVVPQIGRTLRDRTRPGVSALSWALTALSCFIWMLYGIRTGELPQVPGNVLLVSGAASVVLLVPSVTSTAVRAAGLAAPASLAAILAITLPPPAIGFIAFGIGLVSAVPQLVRSIRRRDNGASAVSLLAWVLRVASQACWLIYALALHDLTVTISAGFILSSALVLIASERTRRPAAAPEPAAVMA